MFIPYVSFIWKGVVIIQGHYPLLSDMVSSPLVSCSGWAESIVQGSPQLLLRSYPHLISESLNANVSGALRESWRKREGTERLFH